jgi:hypothetical protein
MIPATLKTVRAPVCLLLLSVILCFDASAFTDLKSFAGEWRTKKDRAGKSAITLIILQGKSGLHGKVLLAKLDGTHLDLPIEDAKVAGNALSFHSKDGETTFWWHLTLRKNTRSGFLKGAVGELLIEEKVEKQR